MRCPAALPALALLAGCAIGVRTPSAWALGMAGLVTAVWVAALVLRRCRRQSWLVVALAAGFVLAGAALGARDHAAALHPPLLARAETNRELLSRDDPVIVTGRLRADSGLADSGARLDLGVETVRIGGQDLPARGGILVSVAGVLVADRVDEWRAGRRVRMPTLLRRPSIYRNAGMADDGRGLARRGVVLLGSVKSAALVEVVEPAGPLAEGAAEARAFVRQTLARRIGRHSPQSAGLVAAILIGDRAGLTADVERRLQEAGTYHVIAISGGNIAILAGLLMGVLRLVGCASRPAAVLTAVGLVAYAGVVGNEASVMRATLVAVLYLGARALDHRGPPANALAVAAACILAIHPLAIFDAGFLLSFGATLAILIGVEPLVDTVRRAARDRDVRLGRWVNAPLALLAATACAELAVFPISASVFSRVTFAGFALNFLAIPLMTVVQVAGLATLAAELLHPWVSNAAGFVAHAAATGLVESAWPITLAPWLARRVPAPAAWLVAAYYGGWLVWLAAQQWRRVGRGGLGVATAAGVLVLAAPPVARWTDRRAGLRVTCFDVAQGDATLVQFPDGRSLLVDAGGAAGRFDIGARVVAPALWRLGVRRLDYLAVTHGDPDHAGGALAVVSDFRPRELWEGVPVPREERLERLAGEAARRAVARRQQLAGDRLVLGGVELTTLHPPAPEWERQKVRNDDSLVFELRYGDLSVVLLGDIGREVEPVVARRLSAAPLRIVKAAHHGSATSSTWDFIRAARPAAVVFSAGRGNRFGHPHPAVVERYRQAGAAIFRTDEDGAVTVETDGHTVRVTTYTGRMMTFDGRNTKNTMDGEAHEGQDSLHRRSWLR